MGRRQPDPHGPGRGRADAHRLTAELVGRFHAGTLPPVAAEAVAGFLARYGERAVAEIDLGLPRWSEDPAHVLGVIANYLRLDDPALAPDALFAKGAAEAEQTIDALSRRAGGAARPGGAVRPRSGPVAGRSARAAEVLWSRRWPPSGHSSSPSGPS